MARARGAAPQERGGRRGGAERLCAPAERFRARAGGFHGRAGRAHGPAAGAAGTRAASAGTSKGFAPARWDAMRAPKSSVGARRGRRRCGTGARARRRSDGDGGYAVLSYGA